MVSTTGRRHRDEAAPHSGNRGRERGRRGGNAAEQAEELQARLVEQVEQLADSDQWRQFLQFCGSFHSYSLRNVLLILSQHSSATHVAGYRQWQDKGRQVRRGEKAIKILGYSTKKITEIDPDTGEEKIRKIPRFPVLSVFALDQTDPIDDAEDHSSVAERLYADDPAGIYQRVEAEMTRRGWSIVRHPLPGEIDGITATDGSRRIVIDANLSEADAAATALHEAAHAILHAEPQPPDHASPPDTAQPDAAGSPPATDGVDTTAADAGNETAATDPVPGDRDEQVGLHRGQKEIEAESVAYVLAGMAGLDTSRYSVGYITGWADGDVDKVRAAAENVLRGVRDLAPAVTPETTTDPAAGDEYGPGQRGHADLDERSITTAAAETSAAGGAGERAAAAVREARRATDALSLVGPARGRAPQVLPSGQHRAAGDSTAASDATQTRREAADGGMTR